MNEKWFALSIEDIEKKLKTNAASGLSVKAARSRCENKERPFFTVKRKSWDKLLLDILSDFFLIMLLFVAIFSLFFEGDSVIGSAMLILLAINIGASFFFYYRDRRGLDTMTEFFSPTARVVRGGKLYIADYRDVAIGDVIIVEPGDILGCDARIVHSDGLSVLMKLDKKREKLLDKYASGAVAENEVHAENMSNMLHAGSVVQKGSARAIVVATGEYTYLGAMTGGITELPSSELPEGLASLKKNFSKIGTLLLILTLPFCLFSLLFGHFTGGTIVLSEVISVVLAIGSTATLSRASNLFIGFYSRFIRRSALADDPCIIRSAAAFDKLSTVDYLFMLDGSITTDGILHFDSIATVEGDTDNFDLLGKSAISLCDMIALYSMARKNALSVSGSSQTGNIDIAIDEFMARSGADTEALRIRCKIHSFISSFDGKGSDRLQYFDKGEKREMIVSLSSDAIGNCSAALFAGVSNQLSAEGKETIKNNFEKYVNMGKRPIVFTINDGVSVCFAGMLLLREGVDDSIAKAVAGLRKNNVKIIAFSNCVGRAHVPEIPEILRRGSRVYAGDMLKRGLPITHEFGIYDEYCGFDAASIKELADLVKSKGKTLAVLGFSNYAEEAIEKADLFITCSPVKAGAFGHLDEEIRSLEIPGEQSSASCTQAVKASADILLMRPSENKGGLGPLAKAIEYCKVSYRNLKNFTVYLVIAHVMRIITIAFPMLLGNSTADARQLIFLSAILDFFAMMIFMNDTRRCTEEYRGIRAFFKEQNAYGIIRSNLKLSVCALVGSVLTLLLPTFFGLFSFFGGYVYRAEFTFMALLMMNLALLVCVYANDLRNVSGLRRFISDRWSIAALCVCVLFTLLCLLTPMGALFGIVRNPVFYFLLSFVPPIAFILCFFFTSVDKNKKEKM